MRFIDLDKKYIMQNSIRTDDGFYRYSLGNSVEVMCMNSKHDNSYIADNLSSEVTKDKFMVKYNPVSDVYFSDALIHSDSSENTVSFFLDKKSTRLFVGTKEEFDVSSGVLMFSGRLSLNGFIEKQRRIFGNNKVKNTLLKRVRVLSVGLRGTDLFALYYIPNARGIVVEDTVLPKMGITMSGFKQKSTEGMLGVTVDDWFKIAKVREV